MKHAVSGRIQRVARTNVELKLKEQDMETGELDEG